MSKFLIIIVLLFSINTYSQCDCRGIFTNSLYYVIPLGDCDAYTACVDTWYLTPGSCSEEDFCVPLPIELEFFEGNNEGSINHINWVTSSEINNDYFILERSRDVNYWEEIATFQGAGNSNTPVMYEFKDEDYIDGINYYRLTQVDFDGKFETFNIVAISTKPAIPWQTFKVINLLGQEVSLDYIGVRIIIFEDGRSILIPAGMRNPKITR